MNGQRVLLVLLSRTYGGAEARVLATASALGSRCTVATLAGSPLHQRLLAEQHRHIAITSRRGSPRTLAALYTTLRGGPYTVMDAHNIQSIWWGALAAALAGTPRRIATIHSDYAAEYPGLKGRLYAEMLSAVRGLLNQTIAVTPELADRHPNSRYIPNAVPVPPQPTGPRRHELAAEWGFAPDDFIVGIIGRLVPVKGHRYLFDALAQLRDAPHIKLVVVGVGALEATLRDQAVELELGERVHFAGFRTDILAVMRNLDVLCVPSLSEALPYVVLEAASEARPLVVTAVGGLRELLVDNETAIIVNSADPRALAAALHSLAQDTHTARRLGLAAYRLVRGRFSTHNMIEATLAAYNSN